MTAVGQILPLTIPELTKKFFAVLRILRPHPLKGPGAPRPANPKRQRFATNKTQVSLPQFKLLSCPGLNTYLHVPMYHARNLGSGHYVRHRKEFSSLDPVFEFPDTSFFEFSGTEPEQDD